VADIDPRIKQFEEEAAKTLAAMKRSARRADAFSKEVDRGQASRDELDQRVRKEVARDRIKGETIGEGGGRTKSRKAIEGESSATEKAGRQQEKMTRLQEQARVSEERLTKARVTGTKQILTQEEAVRRYGKYAGQRYIQQQGPGATVPTRAEARAQAVTRQGEFAGGGGFDRRFPPPPPPPPSGGGGRGGGFDSGGPKKFNEELVKEQRNLQRLQGGLARSTAEHQRLIQVQASGSNVLRRNGALTTEFIQAAARGEVTIRELGYQTASTIGKFGGWITAGAALYTALGAAQKLGAGALDAASGVNQLERVVNNVNGADLTSGFSELADYFQLPIGEVTEGVYEVGKVFHDQNDALEASKALLYSVKVGELDTATAGRYLISITNAYNLSQKDLNDTFDKFNQLQNNYGVAISGTEAATARAAGSFANAGGELDYLIALIGTASRVTGAAPERIGTALQRSPSFIHKPSNEQVLKSFGINPNQDIDSIFNEAFKAAENVSGKKRRQLASALFGPQYGAGVGTPLLRQYDTFKKIQKSIEHSKGSGARELATLKESPEEQLKNIGVQLERLGTGLAKSGVLDEIAFLVLGLDDVLRLANSLVEAFNGLPDPIRTALSLMLQLSLVSRGLGRLNLGEPRPGKEAGPGRTFAEAALGGGGKRDARLIRKGLYDEKSALEDERARSADQAREQSSRALSAEQRALDENKRRVGLMGAAERDEKAITSSKAAQTVYEQEAANSRQASISASLDEEQKAKRLNEVNRRLEQGRGRFGKLNVQGTLASASERGGYYPTTFDVPTTQRPGQYPGGAPGAEPPIIGPQQFPDEKDMAKAEKEAQRSQQKMSRVKIGAEKLGNTFNRLLGSMGNLIFAAFTIGVVAELLSSQADAVAKEIEAIAAPSDNAKSRSQNLKRLTEGGQSGDNFKQRLTNIFTETTDIFGVDVPSLGLGNNGVDEQINEAERIAADTIKAELQAQRRARKTGQPIPYRFVSEIGKDIERLKSGNVPAKRARELIGQYREELAKSYEATNPNAGKDAKDKLKQAYAALRSARVSNAKPQDLRQTLEGLEPKEIQEHLDAEVTQAGFFGGLTKNRIKRARQTYAALASQLGGSKDPEAIALLSSARDAYFEGLEQQIQAELDHSTTLSRSPQATNDAYRRAYQSLTRAYGGGGQQVQAEEKRLQALQRRLRTESAEPEGGQFHGFGNQPGDPAALKKLQSQIQAQKSSLKSVREDVKQKREFLKQIKQELREQQYEENSALREARTNLKVSRTADPLVQVRLKLTAINVEIGQAIKVFGRQSKEVLELLAQRQEIIAEQAQDQLNLIDAKGSLAAAGFSGKGDEADKARVELGTMQQKLAFMQSRSNRFDPAEIIQLQADIREAQISLAELVEQEAEELALASIDIKIARAEAGGNDVRSARLNVQKAKYELGHADTKVEKKQARADLIGKKAALRDARLQQSIEDIEFEADIGKLTLDQQIAAYQRLLSTQKLTRDARRDLRRKIYALKKETEDDSTFDLTVGNIKLPTIYEIRRATKGGVNGGGVNVSQTNNYQINGAGDPKGVALEINKLNGGANKAALRSAGVR
jgi:TP901 family phage tail tape measure protein